MNFLLLKSKDVNKDPITGNFIAKDQRAFHHADIVMLVDENNNHETYILKNRYGLWGKVVKY